LGSLGLRFVVEKTQSSSFMKRRGSAEPRQWLEGQTLLVGASLKYFGVTLKKKEIMFDAHLRHAIEKAQRMMVSLSGLMPNVGSPRECKRHLLVSVV